MEDDKKYIVRVDSNPPLYFGPYTKDHAQEVSDTLQERFLMETGTYMLVSESDGDVDEALTFNHPDYEEPDKG